MTREHSSAGDAGTDFDARLRDALRAVAASTRADDAFTARLLDRHDSRGTARGGWSRHRRWVAPLLAAAAVVAVVVGVAIARAPHPSHVPVGAPPSAMPTFTVPPVSSPTQPVSSTPTLSPSPGHSARTTRHHTSTPTSPPPSPPSRSTTSSSSPPPAEPCTSYTGMSGTRLTLCPGAAAVGQWVTITGDGLCGAADARGLSVMFGGPKTFAGIAGGGNEVRFTATHHGFVAHYRIPPTYQSGDQTGHQREPFPHFPVEPGKRFGFFTYPAAQCFVPLTVIR